MNHTVFVHRSWFERRCRGMAQVTKDLERTARWGVQGLREFCGDHAYANGYWYDGCRIRNIKLIDFQPLNGGDSGLVTYRISQ